MKRVINAKKPIIIPPKSTAVIEIYYLDLSNRNFLFKSIEDLTLLLYIDLIRN